MVKDVIVVGAGIIGATIAKAFSDRGLDVVLLDDAREMSGTAPSGGHLKPSWFGDLKKKDYEPAMKLLDETWGLLEEQFSVRAVGVTWAYTTVYRVDTDAVVSYPKETATVVSLREKENLPVVRLEDGREIQGRLLVVATGVWAQQLVPGMQITAKRGVSFRLPGQLKKGPFIKPWAPFKQVVAHQQSDSEIWVGDGSAIIAENWTDGRTQACLDRCQRAVGRIVAPIRTLTGYRPYAKSEGPCLLQKIGPSAWVATGAGKSGTIAAGWAAFRLLNCF